MNKYVYFDAHFSPECEKNSEGKLPVLDFSIVVEKKHRSIDRSKDSPRIYGERRESFLYSSMEGSFDLDDYLKERKRMYEWREMKRDRERNEMIHTD